MREHRLSAPVFVLGTMALVILVGLLAVLVTWLAHPKTKAPCTLNCPPPELPQSVETPSQALAEQGSYAGATGYHLEYPAGWKVESKSDDKVVFSTRHGELEVQRAPAGQTASQLIDERIAGFKSPQLPDLAPVGPIHGAHIGSAEADGALYSATFTPSSGAGRSLLVRIGVIVAKKGPTTLVATAFVPYDQASGRAMGDDIDYAMAEFRWPGE